MEKRMKAKASKKSRKTTKGSVISWPTFKKAHIKSFQKKFGKAQPELVDLLNKIDQGEEAA